jgi:hypothetical protein
VLLVRCRGSCAYSVDRTVDLTIATARSLVRLRRDDLVRLCECRDLDVDGTKPQLAEALLQWRDRKSDASSPSSAGTARPPSTTRPRANGRRKRSKSCTQSPPVLLRSDHILLTEPRTPPLSSGQKEDELELDLESLGLEDREIPPDKLTKLEKIGSGGFKDVFIGRFKGRKVALAEFRGQLSSSKCSNYSSPLRDRLMAHSGHQGIETFGWLRSSKYCPVCACPPFFLK